MAKQLASGFRVGFGTWEIGFGGAGLRVSNLGCRVYSPP